MGQPHRRTSPDTGAAGIVTRGNKLLLGQSKKKPIEGKWVLPGGRVKPYESLINALAREFHEEIKLRIDCIQPTDISRERIDQTRGEHAITLFFRAVSNSGTPVAGGDLIDARFMTKAEIRKLHAQGDLTAITVSVLKEIGWL